MSIHGQAVGTVQAKTQNAGTNESIFRTGMSDYAQQINSTQVLLDTELGDVRLIDSDFERPRSDRLRMLGNIPDSEVDRTHRVMTNQGVVAASGSQMVNLRSAFVTIFHTGTGTVTINVDADTPDGAAFYVATEGTLTMAYTGDTNSRGISLGNATKLASGAYNRTADSIYFSETVY